MAMASLLVAAGCGGEEQSGAPLTTAPTAATSTTGIAAGASSTPGPTAPGSTATASGPERFGVTILDRRPHDPAAFTQGLLFTDDGRLFESLGLMGQSTVREVDPETGAVILERRLAPELFGEGLAQGPDGLVQLTWKEGKALTWSVDDLIAGPEFPLQGEGWGLTFDGEHFVQSDGSNRLTVRDATTFSEIRVIEVRLAGAEVDELNELEWVDGVIYANVWHSDEIYRIDPATGAVTAVIDASSLWQDPDRTDEMTLNGIAHRPGDPSDRLWLTGKNWPEMFEVQVTGK